jgi:hypothetical protein
MQLELQGQGRRRDRATPVGQLQGFPRHGHHGGDWADWRLPQNDEDDDTDRAARIRSCHQRLCDALRDTLATHRKKRPPRSQWRPEMQRPRRTR